MRPKIPTPTAHRQAGLTLIELMIAVVIVGILAAVGYASYSNYIVKSKRSQAEACLQEAAQFMERFYTTNLRYDLTPNGDAVSLPNTACVQDMRGNYSLSVSTVSANAFVLQATPNGNQALQDTQCGTLSLSQNGTKTISGGGTVSSCW